MDFAVNGMSPGAMRRVFPSPLRWRLLEDVAVALSGPHPLFQRQLPEPYSPQACRNPGDQFWDRTGQSTWAEPV